MPLIELKRTALRIAIVAVAGCSLAACTKLWAPTVNPYTGQEYYPGQFCGILYNCAHDEQDEPGGDGQGGPVYGEDGDESYQR